MSTNELRRARRRAAAVSAFAAFVLGGCVALLSAEPAGDTAAPSVQAEESAGVAGADAEAGTLAGASDPGSPLGKDWVFLKVNGYDGPLPGPPPVPGFILTRQGRRMAGSTACNPMTAEYTLDIEAGALSFSTLRNSRQLCGEAASDTEQAVLDAMIATDGFRIADGKLELLSKGNVVAVLGRPPH